MMTVEEALNHVARVVHDLREVEDEFERRLRELRRKWMVNWEAYLSEVPDERYDDIERALEEYFRDGTADLPEELLEQLEGSRDPYLEGVSDLLERLGEVETELEASKEVLVHALRDWFQQARAEGPPALAMWRDHLISWRRTVRRTTRDAADILGVSSAAVVRYEKNQRTPSAAQVADMIEGIASHPLLPEDDEERRTIRRAAQMLFDENAEEQLVEMIDRHQQEVAGYVQTVEDRLDALNETQLKVLAALVRSPDALDALAEWAAASQLAPVASALGARETS